MRQRSYGAARIAKQETDLRQGCIHLADIIPLNEACHVPYPSFFRLARPAPRLDRARPVRPGRHCGDQLVLRQAPPSLSARGSARLAAVRSDGSCAARHARCSRMDLASSRPIVQNSRQAPATVAMETARFGVGRALRHRRLDVRHDEQALGRGVGARLLQRLHRRRQQRLPELALEVELLVSSDDLGQGLIALLGLRRSRIPHP